MKKLLGLFVAALLVAGFVGQARADIADDNELIRVVYNTTFQGGQPVPGTGTNEVITDLGNINTLLSTVTSAHPVIVGGGVNAFTGFGSAFAASNGANLMVTYYAGGWSTANGTAYISGSQQLLSGGNYGNTFLNAYTPLVAISPVQDPSNAYFQAGTNTGVISQKDSSSNSFTQNVEGPPGTYAQFLNNTSNALATESRLTALATGGTVSQNLYYFSNGAMAQTGSLVTNGNGQAIQIITEANGSTEFFVAPATVPVPPTLLLLAPGLLGLFGIRRRMA